MTHGSHRHNLSTPASLVGPSQSRFRAFATNSELVQLTTATANRGAPVIFLGPGALALIALRAQDNTRCGLLGSM